MDIVFSNTKPKYIELYEAIAKMINDGTLKKGEKLPSKRDLALDLNVSNNTIIGAYDLLMDEGYIYTIEKKGYYVSDQITLDLSINKSIKHTVVKDNTIYDFTTGKVSDFESSSMKKIIKNILSDTEYLNKTSYQGDYGLREAIASHLEVNRGIKVSPELIYIGSGTETLRSVIRILDIDNVSMENPGYHKLKEFAENLHIKPNFLALDDSGMVVPNYKSILYSTPFNQYPTGIKMSITRKKEIAKYLNDFDSYLIEDDFDAEFRIKEGPKTSIYSLNPERVIFFSTFSETIYPGLRMSYMILPTKLKEIYDMHYKGYSSNVATLLQIMIREFIASGEYAKYINKRKKEYLVKRKLITDILDKNNIEYYKDKNYLSLLVKINPSKEADIINNLKKKGIRINTLNDFDEFKGSKGTLIIGYTSIKMDLIEDGMNEIVEILKKTIIR